jgi:asparagine synthase (glutamine-hydrolysing)
MFRYMAFVWDGAGPRDTVCQLIRRLQSTDAQWAEVLQRDGLRVLCSGAREKAGAAHLLHGRLGVVLGTLFEKEGLPGDRFGVAPPALSEKETAAILASKGRRLVERYWGRYVAFLADPDANSRWIIKDPCGQMPCFITEYSGIHIVFSLIEDCLSLGLPDFSINWEYVKARVILGELQAQGTVFREVEPVYGGECLHLQGSSISRSFVWHPLKLDPYEGPQNPHAAARELRSTVYACIDAWTSRYASILLRASGGLDSSIILAGIRAARSQPSVTCVTYYVPGNARDERPWARLAVSGSGFEHVEQERSTRVDWGALSRTALSPYPVPIFPHIETGLLERPIARARDLEAVFTGDGGDSVFGRYAGMFATAQYLRDHGLTAGLLKVAADQAMIADKSFSRVLLNAFRARLFEDGWKQLRAWAHMRQLPAREAFEDPRAQMRLFAHPWFRNVDPLPLTTVLRLGPLLQPSWFYDALARADTPAPEPVVPLASQPVIELSLRIPVHWHIEGGQSRALARRAFADDVPEPILTRDWKDRAPGFFEQLWLSARPSARELLLDGILVREKLLNRSALEKSLAGGISRTSTTCAELFDYMQIEAWLRTWIGKRHRAAA